MKSPNSVLLIILIGLVAWLCFRSCGSEVVPVVHGDSIRTEIVYRDSLIPSRDCVLTVIRNTREIIHDYRIETDTVLKIQLCDSMAVKCDSLAFVCNRADSLHREQIASYASLVGVLDSVIAQDSVTIKKLKRRNKILGGIAVVASVVALVR